MKKKTDFFWTSYTDLMISLFFLMLVLFALLDRERKRFKSEAQILSELDKVEKQIKDLEKTGYFSYQAKYKRHVLKQSIYFPIAKSTITRSEDLKYLAAVGRIIDTLVNKTQDNSIRYLIIIEGMASKFRKDNPDFNYELSYRRAYELLKLWKILEAKGEINLTKRCELLVAGSGVGGVGREEDEIKNQRFLIQIIPKLTVARDSLLAPQ